MSQNTSRGSYGNRPPQGGGSRSAGYAARDERGAPPTIDVSAIRFGDKIDLKLYSDVAENAAKEVGKQIGGRDTNKSTQLRRFYDELIMLHDKIGSDAARYEVQVPFIQMLKAKVAYSMGRKKVDANFDKLLRTVVDEVKDVASLRQAKLFMEAFMAFYKLHGPRERD